MSRLLIWGAGGHAKVVLDCAAARGAWEQIAFIDDMHPDGGIFRGRLLFRSLTEAQTKGFDSVLVAIGDNRRRAACFEIAIAAGLSGAIVIDPSAVVSSSADIGPGTVVMPRAIVNADARIGANVIINTGAVIEHDCIVGDHAHISPGAALGGGARVGAFAHIGLNATLLPLADVGEAAVAGAGSVILRRIPDGVIAAGVPAKPIHT